MAANELFRILMKDIHLTLEKNKNGCYSIYDIDNCKYREGVVYTAREVIEEIQDFVNYYFSVLNLEIGSQSTEIAEKLSAEPKKFLEVVKSFEHSTKKIERNVWKRYKVDIAMCDLIINHIDEVDLDECYNKCVAIKI